MRTQEVWDFAYKRHCIYLYRAAGRPAVEWTDDPIFQQYRFCNVYRELDTVTAWLRVHWREPHAANPDLWFAFVIARHMNNIPMLEALGGVPLPWDPKRFLEITEARRKARAKVFSGAYLISTNGTKYPSKSAYLVDYVFDPMWAARDRIRPQPGDTLTAWHMQLGLWHGLGSFLSAQVIADVKHVAPLRQASDWHTFCASGPGSRRGMNRVLERPLKQAWREDEFRLRVNELQERLKAPFLREGWAPPDAQDTQNILCEFDKYERTRLGEGRPKQLFRHIARLERGRP
jgi:hypothetical protein